MKLSQVKRSFIRDLTDQTSIQNFNLDLTILVYPLLNLKLIWIQVAYKLAYCERLQNSDFAYRLWFYTITGFVSSQNIFYRCNEIKIITGKRRACVLHEDSLIKLDVRPFINLHCLCLSSWTGILKNLVANKAHNTRAKNPLCYQIISILVIIWQ